MVNAFVINPVTKNKSSSDARKVPPKIWGPGSEIQGAGLKGNYSCAILESPDRSLGETNFLVCLFEPDCFSPLSSRSWSCHIVTPVLWRAVPFIFGVSCFPLRILTMSLSGWIALVSLSGPGQSAMSVTTFHFILHRHLALCPELPYKQRR